MKKIELISDFDARSYQQSIFANSIDKNSLVVLPTGLGKTVIAIMLTVYYFNKNPNKKVLFLAPTKPLVEQQEVSFRKFFTNSEDFKFQVLTGTVSPSKRAAMYKDLDFIFSTPQLIENDIVNRIVDPKDFGFIVFDEAHRATGNYSYCFIAQEFEKAGAKILALSASPGTSLEDIRAVMENLRIEHVEVKKHDDIDVAPYVNKTKTEHVIVELSEEFGLIQKKLDRSYKKRLIQLKDLGFLHGKDPNALSKKDILDLQAQLRMLVAQGDAEENIWLGISISAAIMKLQYAIELFESQEITSAYNYMYNFFRPGGDSSKAAQELVVDIDFRDAFDRISKLKKEGVFHPKIIKLKELVFEEINKNKDLKIIIFNQYRDTASVISQELSKIKEIKCSLFFGQAKKGETKMSQKDQKRILDEFRTGEFNVLISTSVGEEGLDIPKVDLVIFYEPVPSAIRTIQRIGRTGRFKEGKAYVLQALGTRDMITRYVANAKERRMYDSLEKIKKELGGITYEKPKKELGLDKFFDKTPKSEGDENSSGKNIDAKDMRIPIYVDNRENNDLIKELFSIDEIRVDVKKLDVGDIVISEHIAIERKSKADFVNSIIDKRLFPQLMELNRNFKRPLLIIEGTESIYSIRNVNPNVIRAALSAISIDLRIPILFTESMKETANMILTIAKRTIKPKKDISLATDKQAFSENEEMEKFVSSIPRINVVTAKSLLMHFKTLKDLVNASEKDLMECEGVGKLRAKFLKDFFEREYQNM